MDVRTGPAGLTAASMVLDATVPFELVAEQIGEGVVVGAGPRGEATVERSAELLGRRLSVSARGTVEVVDGRLVIVDAPCSGVQMAWFGYFSACAVTLYLQRGNQTFLTRLPAVSMLVLAGNVLRNTVLVAAEAAGSHVPGWVHEGVGLAVLAAVCAAIAWLMARPEKARHV